MKNELSGVYYEEQVCHKIFIIYSLTISIVMTSIYTGMVAEMNYITGKSIFRVLKGIIDYQICYLLVGLVFIFAPLCYLQYFNIKILIKFSKEKKPIVKSQIKRLLVFLVIILICILVTQIIVLINNITLGKIMYLTEIFIGIQRLYGLF
jgi:hypothetical protein